jgi:hypothetical protein
MTDDQDLSELKVVLLVNLICIWLSIIILAMKLAEILK